MMLPSHLLATLLAGALVSRVRPFTPKQWALAVGFGVVIDLDHLLQLPAYLSIHGAAGLAPADVFTWGSAWQGVMHTPWALIPVAAACIAFRSTVPAAFWGLHMVQDFVIARHFVRWGGPVEWMIVAGLAAALILELARDHRARGEGRTLLRHAGATFGLWR